MIWFFERGSETTRLETRFDNDSKEYLLIIEVPGQQPKMERFKSLQKFHAPRSWSRGTTEDGAMGSTRSTASVTRRLAGTDDLIHTRPPMRSAGCVFVGAHLRDTALKCTGFFGERLV